MYKTLVGIADKISNEVCKQQWHSDYNPRGTLLGQLILFTKDHYVLRIRKW